LLTLQIVRAIAKRRTKYEPMGFRIQQCQGRASCPNDMHGTREQVFKHLVLQRRSQSDIRRHSLGMVAGVTRLPVCLRRRQFLAKPGETVGQPSHMAFNLLESYVMLHWFFRNRSLPGP
jgi:hypothetical protein